MLLLWQARFFSSLSYIIGGHTYTLSEIEHGMLRGMCLWIVLFQKLILSYHQANRKPPNSFRRLIKKTDPRAAFVCVHRNLIVSAFLTILQICFYLTKLQPPCHGSAYPLCISLWCQELSTNPCILCV